jgi:hypothetical protein
MSTSGNFTATGTGSFGGALNVSAGTAGDAILTIEADTDNSDEGDHPSLRFKQDGALVDYRIGIGADDGDVASTGNSLFISQVAGGVEETTVYFKKSGGAIHGFWHAGNDGGGSGLDADLLDGLQASQFHRNDVSVLHLGGEFSYTGATRWFVSQTDTAHQRADGRDDATNFSRLHWYGVSDTGATSNFRHAWYDGASYINVDASAGTVFFTGGIDSTSTITASSKFKLDAGQVETYGGDARVKFSVWTGATYGVGMSNSYTFGGLSGYAMSFQMDNTPNRGFWWGTNGQTNAQGAMSLNTSGALSVALGARIGYGTSDTTAATQGLQVSGTIVATGNITGNSDKRLKTNIKPIENALEKIHQIDGCTWDRTDMELSQAGFIAQDMQKVLPVSVMKAEDEMGTLSVDQGNAMTALLLQAVKELTSRVKELEKQINNG